MNSPCPSKHLWKHSSSLAVYCEHKICLRNWNLSIECLLVLGWNARVLCDGELTIENKFVSKLFTVCFLHWLDNEPIKSHVCTFYINFMPLHFICCIWICRVCVNASYKYWTGLSVIKAWSLVRWKDCVCFSFISTKYTVPNYTFALKTLLKMRVNFVKAKIGLGVRFVTICLPSLNVNTWKHILKTLQ